MVVSQWVDWDVLDYFLARISDFLESLLVVWQPEMFSFFRKLYINITMKVLKSCYTFTVCEVYPKWWRKYKYGTFIDLKKEKSEMVQNQCLKHFNQSCVKRRSTRNKMIPRWEIHMSQQQKKHEPYIRCRITVKPEINHKETEMTFDRSLESKPWRLNVRSKFDWLNVVILINHTSTVLIGQATE